MSGRHVPEAGCALDSRKTVLTYLTKLHTRGVRVITQVAYQQSLNRNVLVTKNNPTPGETERSRATCAKRLPDLDVPN